MNATQFLTLAVFTAMAVSIFSVVIQAGDNNNGDLDAIHETLGKHWQQIIQQGQHGMEQDQELITYIDHVNNVTVGAVASLYKQVIDQGKRLDAIEEALTPPEQPAPTPSPTPVPQPNPDPDAECAANWQLQVVTIFDLLRDTLSLEKDKPVFVKGKYTDTKTQFTVEIYDDKDVLRKRGQSQTDNENWIRFAFNEAGNQPAGTYTAIVQILDRSDCISFSLK